MASFNSALFLALLVAISAILAAPSSVEAQFPTFPRFIFNGSVPCNVNGSASLPACADLSLLGTTTKATASDASVSVSAAINGAAAFEFAIFTGPISSLIESILSGDPTNDFLIISTPFTKFVTETAFLAVDLIEFLSNRPDVTNGPNITRIFNIRPEDFKFVKTII